MRINPLFTPATVQCPRFGNRDDEAFIAAPPDPAYSTECIRVAPKDLPQMRQGKAPTQLLMLLGNGVKHVERVKGYIQYLSQQVPQNLRPTYLQSVRAYMEKQNLPQTLIQEFCRPGQLWA